MTAEPLEFDGVTFCDFVDSHGSRVRVVWSVVEGRVWLLLDDDPSSPDAFAGVLLNVEQATAVRDGLTAWLASLVNPS